MSNIFKNLINGEWVSSSNITVNVNPSDTNDTVGEFASATAQNTEDAIMAARKALPIWTNITPQAKADILDTIGSTIINRKDEIGRLLSREEGKPLAEGIGETVRAGQIFKFYAQEIVRNAGDILPSLRPNVDVEVTREAVGVIGIITPWNFPIAIPAWKIAPALAYGNTVVFKPAELTPASAHVLAKIIHEFGCPDGVFNLVSGPGSVVGQTITEHPEIDAITFTGSGPVGRRLAATAIGNMKKIQLEMGGKNPMVVLDDADIDLALNACLNGSFFSTGQKCTASSRLIVQSGIHDEFVVRLTTLMTSMNIGNALDPKTQMGPVASDSQLANNLKYVDIAKAEGAQVIGGERIETMPNGFYQNPALFVGAHNKMRIAQEEIFGPCATIIKVDDFEQAVDIANDTKFGLTSGICTSSLKFAREFKRRSEAGMVMVNLPTSGVDYHVPFGGRKQSSYGSREQGRYAAEFYTVVKTAYVAT